MGVNVPNRDCRLLPFVFIILFFNGCVDSCSNRLFGSDVEAIQCSVISSDFGHL